MRTRRQQAKFLLRGGDRGYSLPEVLIASFVLVIVLLAIYIVYDTGLQDYARGTARADVQQNVRVALESMARELRMAGYNPYTTSCTPAPPPPAGYLSSDIVGVTGTTLSSTSVPFWADVDGDNCPNQVTYTFVAPTNPTKPCDSSDPTTIGRITRSVQAWNGTAWSPTTPTAYDIAQCITALVLTYCDGSAATTCGGPGAPAATPKDVRRITLSITGQENIRGFGASTYTLVSDVRLRNP